MLSSEKVLVFCGLGETSHLASDTLRAMNILRFGQPDLTIEHINFKWFSSGQLNFRIPRWRDIQGKDVIFFSSTYNDTLITELKDLVQQFNNFGAKNIILVTPYLAYTRSDRPELKAEHFRLLTLLEEIRNMGGYKPNGEPKLRLIVADPHSIQVQKVCRRLKIKLSIIDPTPEYVARINPHIQSATKAGRDFYFYSPDLGSLERNCKFASEAGGMVALNPKKRDKTQKASVWVKASSEDMSMIRKTSKKYGVEVVIADKAGDKLKGADVCIREDELSTGTTLRRNCDKLKNHMGVNSVLVCVTHAVCVTVYNWKDNVGDTEDTPFEIIYCGDTIHRTYEHRTGGVLKRVSMSKLFAHAVVRAMNGLKH